MKKQWKLVNSIVTRTSNTYTWIGVIANETRNMIYKNLRKQGISIDLQGIEFYNKCVDIALDNVEVAVDNVFKNKIEELRLGGTENE